VAIHSSISSIERLDSKIYAVKIFDKTSLRRNLIIDSGSFSGVSISTALEKFEKELNLIEKFDIKILWECRVILIV